LLLPRGIGTAQKGTAGKSLSLGTMSWMYMLGPVAGGIVGAQVYNY